jgi:hypothetical protein
MRSELPYVFISHSSKDRIPATAVSTAIEMHGIRCWVASRDIQAGMAWGEAIADAISGARAVVLLFSQAGNVSLHVYHELNLAVKRRIPVVPVRIEEVPASAEFECMLSSAAWIDAVAPPLESHFPAIVNALMRVLPPGENGSTAKSRKPGRTRETVDAAEARPAKGYVFISYSRADSDFIDKLKKILKRRGYAYWDYSESERNYHSALYRELEEKIEGAAAFMAVVTDSWRETEWPASEYSYAREAKVPVFVIQAKRLSQPVPIILTLQTRIDMSIDFERGAEILEHELTKKNL